VSTVVVVILFVLIFALLVRASLRRHARYLNDMRDANDTVAWLQRIKEMPDHSGSSDG
jgi:hypothetical protein